MRYLCVNLNGHLMFYIALLLLCHTPSPKTLRATWEFHFPIKVTVSADSDHLNCAQE